MLNMNDKKAMAAKYNDGIYSDHYGACGLIEEAGCKHAIETLCADRACDRHKLYKLCKEHDIKTKVLPKNGAAEHSKIDYMSDRNARLIKLCGEDGVKEWKKRVNYGKRAYTEGFFLRLKRIFGFSLRGKSEISRERELLIKRYLLNKFTDIGMAKFEMVTRICRKSPPHKLLCNEAIENSYWEQLCSKSASSILQCSCVNLHDTFLISPNHNVRTPCAGMTGRRVLK